jgi:TRAP-type transport system periplasmic protein
MRIANLVAGAVIAGLASTAVLTGASAEPNKINLKVVGTWGFLNEWKEVEKPYWTEQLKEETGGNVTADMSPMTDLGLKGFEVMRMLQLGIFDVAHGIISYLGEDPVAEGIDLAAVGQDWESARKIVDSYRDIIAKRFDVTYKTKLLAIYPFPRQFTYCNAPIKSLEDFKGLKFRSFSKSMSDLITGFGGTPVTISYGETVPALQLKTVDCAVTGSLPAYTSGWGAVTTHIVHLNMGYTFAYVAISNATWAKLNEETRKIITDGVTTLEMKGWEVAARDSDLGVACLTDGPCSAGEPAGLVDVELSASDDALRRKVLEESVLPSYAERCGAECVEQWNATIGKAVDLKIKQ